MLITMGALAVVAAFVRRWEEALFFFGLAVLYGAYLARTRRR
jgi:hypothetical protein